MNSTRAWVQVRARGCADGCRFGHAGMRVQVRARGHEGAGSGTRAWVRTWACGRAVYTVDLFLYYVL
jgi:hypothetical protein